MPYIIPNDWHDCYERDEPDGFVKYNAEAIRNRLSDRDSVKRLGLSNAFGSSIANLVVSLLCDELLSQLPPGQRDE